MQECVVPCGVLCSDVWNTRVCVGVLGVGDRVKQKNLKTKIHWCIHWPHLHVHVYTHTHARTHAHTHARARARIHTHTHTHAEAYRERGRETDRQTETRTAQQEESVLLAENETMHNSGGTGEVKKEGYCVHILYLRQLHRGHGHLTSRNVVLQLELFNTWKGREPDENWMEDPKKISLFKVPVHLGRKSREAASFE